MKDMEAHLEKLRTDAAECAIISGLATDKTKRELFARLSKHLTVLASEVEKAKSTSRAGKEQRINSATLVFWSCGPLPSKRDYGPS